MSAPRVLVSGLVLEQPLGGVQLHDLEPAPAHGASRGLAFALDQTVDVLTSRLPSQPTLVRAPASRAPLPRSAPR